VAVFVAREAISDNEVVRVAPVQSIQGPYKKMRSGHRCIEGQQKGDMCKPRREPPRHQPCYTFPLDLQPLDCGSELWSSPPCCIMAAPLTHAPCLVLCFSVIVN
jgi:hypothetical protein